MDENIQEQLDQDIQELDALLEDTELNALLGEPEATPPEPADREPVTYNNFANNYGAGTPESRRAEREEERMRRKKKKEDRTVLALLITASALCLGIIGILAYWLAVLL